MYAARSSVRSFCYHNLVMGEDRDAFTDRRRWVKLYAVVLSLPGCSGGPASLTRDDGAVTVKRVSSEVVKNRKPRRTLKGFSVS